MRPIVAVSITGQNAFEGENIVWATEAFVREKNKTGGILGRRLRVIVQDDRGEIDTLGKNTQIAVADPNHFLTIGSPYSRLALPASRLYTKNKKLYFTSFATEKTIGTRDSSVFQSSYNDDFQGLVLGQFAFDKLKSKKVMVVTYLSDPYSDGLSSSFIKYARKKSEINIKQVNFISEDFNSEDLVQEFSNFRPDLVFIPMLREKAVEILKVLSKKDVGTTRFLGSDGWGIQSEIQRQLKETLKDSENRKYFHTFFWDPSLEFPLNRKIKKFYDTHLEGDYYVAGVFALEELEMVFAASEKAQCVSAECISQKLREAPVGGTTGLVHFSHSGATFRPILLLELSKTGTKVHSVVPPIL